VRARGRYIDRATNNPAFALCAPLFNLTAQASSFGEGLKADDNGMVSCSRLVLRCERLA